MAAVMLASINEARAAKERGETLKPLTAKQAAVIVDVEINGYSDRILGQLDTAALYKRLGDQRIRALLDHDRQLTQGGAPASTRAGGQPAGTVHSERGEFPDRKAMSYDEWKKRLEDWKRS